MTAVLSGLGDTGRLDVVEGNPTKCQLGQKSDLTVDPDSGMRAYLTAKPLGARVRMKVQYVQDRKLLLYIGGCQFAIGLCALVALCFSISNLVHHGLSDWSPESKEALPYFVGAGLLSVIGLLVQHPAVVYPSDLSDAVESEVILRARSGQHSAGSPDE